MDEREVESLFRSAVDEVPAPTFSVGDVAARSARESARARMRVTVAASFAVVVLAGAGLAGALGSVLDSPGPGSGTSIAADAADPEQSVLLGQRPGQLERHQSDLAIPESARASRSDPGPVQGGEGSADALGSQPGCQNVDRELAIALAGELPATTARTGPAEPGAGPCVEGGALAAYRVVDGGAAGLLSVAFLPPGRQQALPMPAGRAYAEAPTPSGGTLVVISDPAGETAPLAGRLRRIAEALAAGR